MAVRDAYRDSGLFRGHEREHADRVHMGVHDARVNLLEQLPAGVHVLDWVAVWRNVEHSTAQGLDLVLGNHRGIRLCDEIELHLGTINMAVMVHHGGLDTTTHHPADHLGHPNRFLRVVPAGPLIYGMSIDIAHISYFFPCTSRAPQHQKKLPLFNEILLLYLVFYQYAPLWVTTAPTVRNSSTTSPSMDQFCT